MTVLHDLAVDIINTAKATKDVRQKLFQLGQLREILLHRDKTLLSEFIDDMFDFMVDKAVQMRKFIANFAAELLEENFALSLPYVLNVSLFYLTESNDNVVTSIAHLMTKHYSRIVLHIVRAPASASQGKAGPASHDPQQMWESFRTVVTKLHEYISSTRFASLKAACLKLMEEQILFGTPSGSGSGSATLDPRLARKGGAADPRLTRGAQGEASSSAGPTIEDVPLHHSFVSRTLLQREAEDLWGRGLLWLTKGGPQAAPFSPYLMGWIGQVISGVGTLRPNVYAINAAKAVALLIGGKEEVVSAMTRDDRNFLVRAAHRLLRVATVFVSDPEQSMGKLRESLALMDAKDAGEEEGKAGTKRGREEMEGGAEEGNDWSGKEQEALALAALEEAERRKRLELSSSLPQGEVAAGGALGLLAGAGSVPVSEFLELSATILSWHKLELGSTGKLVYVAGQAATGLSLKGVKLAEGGEYSESSLLSLMILMEHFVAMIEKGGKAFLVYSHVLTQTLSSIASSEESKQDTSKTHIKVQIVQSWGQNIPANEQKGLSSVVLLPRSLWLFISCVFTLFTTPEVFAELQSPHYVSETPLNLSPSSDQLTHVISLLSNIANALPASLQADYVLTTLSRLLQHSELRCLAADFLSPIANLPPSILALLFALCRYGSKTIPAALLSNKTSASKLRGLRYEVLNIVGRLVFSLHADTDALESSNVASNISSLCLLELCKFSVSRDFELRSRAIGLIVNDLYQVEEDVDRQLIDFALYCAGECIGLDIVTQYYSIGEIEERSTMQIEDNQVKISLKRVGRLSEKNKESYRACLTYTSDEESEAGAEAKAGRLLHLLSQVVMKEVSLLGAYIEMFTIYTWAVREKQLKTSPTIKNSTDGDRIEADNEMGEETSPPIASGSSWSLSDFIRSSMRILVPALLKQQLQQHTSASDQIKAEVNILNTAISYMSKDSRLLLIEIVQAMHSDFTLPTKLTTLNVINQYVFEQDSGLLANKESVDEHKDLLLAKIGEKENMKIALGAVSGYSPSTVEKALPNMLSLLGEEMDFLKSVFNRITQARPPPLTKSALLTALHRIDIDAYNIKSKILLDAIALCLNSKTEFTGEVIKDSLRTLLQDEIPAFALMRTAIIAAQSFSEVKKYVLSDLIPVLISKEVWASAPKVWDGVIYGIKSLGASGSKQTEPSLIALLSIPGVQLKSVLKVAPNVKPPLAKYLQGVSSAEERERQLSATKDYTADTEKLKLYKEMMSMPTTA